MGDFQKKSTRNRTLQITDEERHVLSEHVVYASELDGCVGDDVVVCGDLTECLSHVPDNYFDLVIADPPYNLDKDFGGVRFKKMGETDYEDYLRSWIGSVVSKLKKNGSLYVCCDWRCSSSVYKVLCEYMCVINRITWQREKGRGAMRNWKNGMEDIYFAVMDKDDYYFDVERVKLRRNVRATYRDGDKPKDWESTAEGNFRMTYPSNFWDDISVPFWSMPENTEHPTQKPEKLIAKLILASSPEGARVFDPFMGSGTTPVVAKKLGRHYVGIDICSEYCLLAAKRLLIADSDKRIQGYDGDVFYERNTPIPAKKTNN